MKKVICLIGFSISTFVCFGQDAIIENWSTEISIEDSKKLIIKEKKRVKILRKEGYDQSVFTSYEDKFSKISALEVVVYDKNGGKIKRMGKANSDAFVLNEENEIGDSKLIYLDPEYQNYPFVVELEMERRYNNGFLNIPLWMPRERFRTEVNQASLTLRKPKDYKLNYDLDNIAEATVSEDRDKEILFWEVSQLEAVDNDISYSQFYKTQSKVSVSPVEFELDNTYGSFENWNVFGEWYLSLNSDPYEFSAETKSFLDGIEGTKREVVDRLYEFLQKRSRYISIQLGIGGYKSLPVNFVDKNGYGDCKALSTYMKSMLDYKGISSNYILVNAGEEMRDLNSSFVSNQFNHVFIGVPFKNDTLFLECTSQMAPAGYLGSFTDDRNVLWLDDEKSQLIHTPSYDEKDNVLSMSGEIELDQYGNGNIQLSSFREGLFYRDLMMLKSIGAERAKIVASNRFDFKDFSLKNFEYEESEGKAPNYTENYEIQVNNLARTSGERILLPMKMMPSVDSYFRYSRYKRISEISRSFTVTDSIKISPPAGFVLRIPDKVEISDTYGSYHAELIDHEDGTYSIKTKTVLKKGLYLEEEFESFNAFFNKVKRAERLKVLLEKKT